MFTEKWLNLLEILFGTHLALALLHRRRWLRHHCRSPLRTQSVPVRIKSVCYGKNCTRGKVISFVGIRTENSIYGLIISKVFVGKWKIGAHSWGVFLAHFGYYLHNDIISSRFSSSKPFKILTSFVVSESMRQRHFLRWSVNKLASLYSTET